LPRHAAVQQGIEIAFQRTGTGTYYASPLDDMAEGKRIIAGRWLTCGVIFEK